MSSPKKLRILVTGCSAGGTGAALAVAFHKEGHYVYATARNLAKLSSLADLGIDTVSLDVTSTSSIAAAVSHVSDSLPHDEGLNVLVNNAAGSYTMPISDLSLTAAKDLFDLNVWSQVAVTQAFLPLLLKASLGTTPVSSATGHSNEVMIVNHTSSGSVTALPFQGVYNASKAAFAMISQTMRLELASFGIKVIELKTAGVRTNLISNNSFNTKADGLPPGSIFEPAREVVEQALSQDGLRGVGITAEQWASEVAAVLLRKSPPAVIWKGESANLAHFASMLPSSMFEGMLKKMTKLDVVEDLIRKSRE